MTAESELHVLEQEADDITAKIAEIEMKSEEEATEETKEGEKADPINIDDDSSTEEDDSSEGSGDKS